MKNFFKVTTIIIVIGAAGYYFRAPLSVVWNRLETQYLPCQQPIIYSIGDFDEEFGISRATFLEDIKQAEAIWEEPIGKNLFEYADDGDLKINLVYDYRQQATTNLKKIGIVVSDTRVSYDNLKEQYTALQASYEQDMEQYESQLASLNHDQEAYGAQVQVANRRGGASKSEYASLGAEREALHARLEQLNELQASLNQKVDTINSMVVALNGMAVSLNLNTAKFNEVGASRGEEFNEGLYRSDISGANIDIFEYSSRQKLLRVLAHEFGHALGLDHVDEPAAIMYRLNQATNEELSASDLAMLEELCAIK